MAWIPATLAWLSADTRVSQVALADDTRSPSCSIELHRTHKYAVANLAQEGVMKGELGFDRDITLPVADVVNFVSGSLQHYSYIISRDPDKLYGYDPQPHCLPGWAVAFSTNAIFVRHHWRA